MYGELGKIWEELKEGKPWWKYMKTNFDKKELMVQTGDYSESPKKTEYGKNKEPLGVL